MFQTCLTLAVSAVVLSAQPAAQLHAQPEPRTRELKRLTLEELTELDITTLSRRVERLSQAPAAVSIVTGEDIRRSGVTQLAEAMRLAGALDVARFDGRTWAISARGFNITTANKLLVMIDGRTVYSPLFGGTFWDVQDTLLHDVDRIEVVRGPGGTIWGANAVNGVVNVITRAASETRGTYAQITAGTQEPFIGGLRHGGPTAGGGSYRVYGKFRLRDENVFTDGRGAADPVRFGQGGFRVESAPGGAHAWLVQGDAYAGSEGLFDRDDTDVSGGNVLGRWIRRFTPEAQFQAQVYYDRVYRRMPLVYEESMHTGDVDLQQRILAGRRHDLVFGGGLRVIAADNLGTASTIFSPRVQRSWLASAFVQDEVRLRSNVFLTAGAKLERNTHTGVEVQPSARLRWSPSEHHAVWAAVSRAVRLPTRFDTALQILDPVSGVLRITGDPTFQPESVLAFEGGYRVRPAPAVIVDVTAFANRYDSLRSQEPAPTGLPLTLENALNARTNGLEVAAALQPIQRWRLSGSFAYLHKSLFLDPGSGDITGGAAEGNDAPYLASLRSFLDLPAHLALDAVFRHVARRPAPIVPAYSELDLRFAWARRAGWELSLVGQNLLNPSHPEFGQPGPLRHRYRRGMYLRSAWRF